ncbi:MAG: tRNA uridine-5-carboxymethylaminomethyl(34) synthesis GTPase MnmE, partial [Clostridia bacterium]|nr:tRNA uridine-5-carboxymethylaminomethyl(34) synthesis GTPase MnmE [Clostridia bacterium]
ANVIAAPATPPGQGGIGIVRMSGEGSAAVLEKIFRPLKGTFPLENRKLIYGHIVEKETAVDEVLAVCFYAPHSYTGEEVCEIQCHAGTQGMQKILSLCFAAGAVPAQPGEFTKRAFLNGKMDLARAEAVMDLISSEAEKSAKSAVLQLEGSISREIDALYDTVADALSGVDAAIDYPEELEEDVYSLLPETLNNVRERMDTLIEGSLKGRILREGYRVVLLGKPNAGKSSLLNAFLGRERAIVTELAGTTRDTIEEPAEFCGLPVLLTDTAGIRETGDKVESIGVQRARAAMEQADLLLLCFDGNQEFGEEEQALLRETEGRERLAVLCKQDTAEALTLTILEEKTKLPCAAVSAKNGEGVEALKERIASMADPGQESVLITNARHAESLKKAKAHLVSAMEAMDADCIATDLHLVLEELGAITGKEAGEDVIDRIFSRFCVGK